jgi:hypothetical protein
VDEIIDGELGWLLYVLDQIRRCPQRKPAYRNRVCADGKERFARHRRYFFSTSHGTHVAAPIEFTAVLPNSLSAWFEGRH